MIRKMRMMKMMKRINKFFEIKFCEIVRIL